MAEIFTDLFGFSSYERLSRSAEISPCGKYRWWLRRTWQSGGNRKVVCFVMLNPSKADDLTDDPTVRKCMGFAKRWNFSTVTIRNLFAYRATDPKELLTAENPTGGERNDVELVSALTADTVIVAWGTKVPFDRDVEVLKLLRRSAPAKPLHCLKLSKDGKPWHPLYVGYNTDPIPFEAVTHG